jgi:hypothetical protein
MKLSGLKEEDLVEIVNLYETYCGVGRKNFVDVLFRPPELVLEYLKKTKSATYRIGSKWDMHSKLLFKVDFDDNIIVEFNPNFDPVARSGPLYEEALKTGKEFVDVAMKYLNKDK